MGAMRIQGEVLSRSNAIYTPPHSSVHCVSRNDGTCCLVASPAPLLGGGTWGSSSLAIKFQQPMERLSASLRSCEAPWAVHGTFGWDT